MHRIATSTLSIAVALLAPLALAANDYPPTRVEVVE